jgi:hypothetical protein
LSSVAAQAEEVEQGKRQERTLSAAAQAAVAKSSMTHSASTDTRHSVRLFSFSSEQAEQAAQHRRSTRRTDSMEPPEELHTSHSTGGILLHFCLPMPQAEIAEDKARHHQEQEEAEERRCFIR